MKQTAAARCLTQSPRLYIRSISDTEHIHLHMNLFPLRSYGLDIWIFKKVYLVLSLKEIK